MEFSLQEKQLFWIVGAMTRLYHMKIIEEPPIVMNTLHILSFINLDNERQEFLSDDDIKTVVPLVMKSENNDQELTESLIQDFTNLILTFKNNREALIQ
jgi:hypothetical protein